MLDLFESVGVQKVDITFTDIDGRKRGFRPAQTIEAARRSMRSSLLQSCVAGQRNVIIRPHAPPGALLIQLDDLDSAALARVTPVAFLVLETSTGNHQAWLAVKGVNDADLGRRVKKAAGADPSASGAVRIAGSVNFKPKYRGDFPTVAILRSAPGGLVTAAQLASMGLVAAAPARVVPFRSTVTLAWPSYERCMIGAPINPTSRRPDSFRADYTWCLIAADWGHSVKAIAARLLQLSTKAQENGEIYATLTAERAAAAVASRPRVGAPARQPSVGGGEKGYQFGG